MRFPRRLICLVPALVLAGWAQAATAQDTASEDAVRAVLLLNFLQFAELPGNGAQSPLTVCVAASDPERLAAMASLQGRQVRGRPLLVRGPEGEGRCDAIYVDSRVHWQAIAEGPGPGRALTVGAYPGFLNDGGIVEIDFRQSRTRFDIHLAHARGAGIRLYPQLLRLARQVIE